MKKATQIIFAAVTAMLLALATIIVLLIVRDSPAVDSEERVASTTLAPLMPAWDDEETIIASQTISNNKAEPVRLAQVPDLYFLNSRDEEVRLSDYRGQILVLNFWASWCPPCTEEMPEFEAFYAKYADHPQVRLLSINLTYGRESRESADAFIDEQELSFPVFFDPTGEAFEPFGLTSIPKTFFVGPDGEAGYLIAGRTDLPELERHLEAMQELLNPEVVQAGP